ncbi:MAG: ATP-binding protein [Treponemataceae bacterium]|nr:MAG: ATP-binding protein [Treponemataceae bacterium]
MRRLTNLFFSATLEVLNKGDDVISENSNAANAIKVDSAKIKLAVRNFVPITIKIEKLTREMSTYAEEVLTIFFREIYQEHLIDYLIYSVKELLVNANKGNTKRVYFEQKKLNILDPLEYDDGMEAFKDEIISKTAFYENLQAEKGYYIKLSAAADTEKLVVKVSNNAVLTDEERKRITDKIALASTYDSVADAMSQSTDTTEGAGLGLTILILMLKKLGVGKEGFSIHTTETETEALIALPIKIDGKESFDIISTEIANNIEAMPYLPENIVQISNMINKDDCSMAEVAKLISNDISLTVELLRFVNSAAVGLVQTCTKVEDAVVLVGIRGIRNLLYSIGAMQTLDKDTDDNAKVKSTALWDHCLKTAFYGTAICSSFFKNEKNLNDDIYVCALLHDMGKLIFESGNQKFIDTLQQFCKEKKIEDRIFEILMSGINHAEVGACIAEKWNFPPVIINAIRSHHNPEYATQEYKKITSIVYLADRICYFQAGEIEFYHISPVVLTELGFNDFQKFQLLSDSLRKKFLESNKK